MIALNSTCTVGCLIKPNEDTELLLNVHRDTVYHRMSLACFFLSFYSQDPWICWLPFRALLLSPQLSFQRWEFCFHCKLRLTFIWDVSLHILCCECLWSHSYTRICVGVLDSCDCRAGTIRRSFSTSSAIATPKETSRRSPVTRCGSLSSQPSHLILPKLFNIILGSGRINTDKKQWY